MMGKKKISLARVVQVAQGEFFLSNTDMNGRKRRAKPIGW